MSRFTSDHFRRAWPGIIIVLLALTFGSYLILQHLGTSLTASGVVELEKDMIQANGLLIAFTGIIFTGMLAEVRFRTERAQQAGDRQRLDSLEKLSKSLRKSAFASFVLFTSSLGDALGNLGSVLASMQASTPMADAFVIPFMLMLGGLVLLLLALALLAFQ